MKLKFLLLIVVLLYTLFFSTKTVAAVELVTKVIAVGVNSNNVVFFNVSDIVEQTGCRGNQVVLSASSVIKDRVLSIALAAKASSAKISLRIAGCYGNAPTIEKVGEETGWIYITD